MLVELPFRCGVLDGGLHQVQGVLDAGLFLEASGDAQPAATLGDQRSLRVHAVLARHVQHARASAGGRRRRAGRRWWR